jgi:hypothetical protein
MEYKSASLGSVIVLLGFSDFLTFVNVFQEFLERQRCNSWDNVSFYLLSIQK